LDFEREARIADRSAARSMIAAQRRKRPPLRSVSSHQPVIRADETAVLTDRLLRGAMLFANHGAAAKPFGDHAYGKVSCFHIKTCLYDYVGAKPFERYAE
jgi:hypothetical protein